MKTRPRRAQPQPPVRVMWSHQNGFVDRKTWTTDQPFLVIDLSRTEEVKAWAMPLAAKINRIHANSLWSRTENPDKVIAGTIATALQNHAKGRKK